LNFNSLKHLKASNLPKNGSKFVQSGSQIIKVALEATFSLQLDWTIEPSYLLPENYPIYKRPVQNDILFHLSI